MALVHLLYRCPRCGHDPMEGAGDRAGCASCGVAFHRQGALIRARVDSLGAEEPPAPWQEGVPPAVLVDALERLGGPLFAATRADGPLRYRARALHHGWLDEAPVRRGGRLLGFVERASPGREGTLEATEEALTFRFDAGGEERWALDRVTALQLASRALQVGMGKRGVLQWTLEDDSPFRWETLLQTLLRGRWRAAGRGRIVEFQPRIVAAEGTP